MLFFWFSQKHDLVLRTERLKQGTPIIKWRTSAVAIVERGTLQAHAGWGQKQTRATIEV